MRRISSVSSFTFVSILISQLVLGPATAVSQVTVTNEELKKRLEQAQVEAAEADARKKELDAEKVRSDIAKQNIDARRAQLDAVKGTSSIEGSLVENNIA